MFAITRDKAIPLSGFLHWSPAATNTPFVANWVSAFLSIGIALFSLESFVAFNAVASIDRSYRRVHRIRHPHLPADRAPGELHPGAVSPRKVSVNTAPGNLTEGFFSMKALPIGGSGLTLAVPPSEILDSYSF